MARVRVMDYGPTVRSGAIVSRQNISNIRQGVSNKATRIRIDKHAITTKSRLRRKIVKGIRQPGYVAPNYPDVEY